MMMPTGPCADAKIKVLHKLAEEIDFIATRYAPSAKYPGIWKRSTMNVTSEHIDIGRRCEATHELHADSTGT